MGRRRTLVLSFAIFTAFGLMQTGLFAALDASPTLEGEKPSAEVKKKLKIAGMQHELILYLIEKQDFDSIESEWKKVLDLKLGADVPKGRKKTIMTLFWFVERSKPIEMMRNAQADENIKINFYKIL